VCSFKPGPFLCESAPKDFTVPAAERTTVLAEAPAFQPPENPTLWQRFLLVLRSVLAWLLEAVERQLAP